MSTKVNHRLKIRTEYFTDVVEGNKTFEIRKNDRGFCVGDIVLLEEFNGTDFTGKSILVEITYLSEYEQKDNYVVFGICKLFFAVGDLVRIVVDTRCRAIPEGQLVEIKQVHKDCMRGFFYLVWWGDEYHWLHKDQVVLHEREISIL